VTVFRLELDRGHPRLALLARCSEGRESVRDQTYSKPFSVTQSPLKLNRNEREKRVTRKQRGDTLFFQSHEEGPSGALTMQCTSLENCWSSTSTFP
jgi:hypothetical protein